MAVAMFMTWPGVTAAQYDAVRKIVNWEGDHPAGGMFHVSAFDDSGLHVTDLWETPEAFQAFVDNRLMPGVMQVGIQGQPIVTMLPVHSLFTPAFTSA